MNDEINLLTTKRVHYDPKLFKKFLMVRLVAIILLFTVCVTSFILFILIAFSPLPSLQAQEQELLGSFSGSERGQKLSKYYSTQNRLGDVSTVLKSRLDVVTIYNTFRKNLTSDMQIDILKVDKKIVTMAATGPSLDSIDSSIIKLQQADKEGKAFKNFSLTRISYNPEAGTYSVFFQITLV